MKSSAHAAHTGAAPAATSETGVREYESQTVFGAGCSPTGGTIVAAAHLKHVENSRGGSATFFETSDLESKANAFGVGERADGEAASTSEAWESGEKGDMEVCGGEGDVDIEGHVSMESLLKGGAFQGWGELGWGDRRQEYDARTSGRDGNEGRRETGLSMDQHSGHFRLEERYEDGVFGEEAAWQWSSGRGDQWGCVWDSGKW
jgi:hypothetical protein